MNWTWAVLNTWNNMLWTGMNSIWGSWESNKRFSLAWVDEAKTNALWDFAEKTYPWDYASQVALVNDSYDKYIENQANKKKQEEATMQSQNACWYAANSDNPEVVDKYTSQRRLNNVASLIRIYQESQWMPVPDNVTDWDVICNFVSVNPKTESNINQYLAQNPYVAQYTLTDLKNDLRIRSIRGKATDVWPLEWWGNDLRHMLYNTWDVFEDLIRTVKTEIAHEDYDAQLALGEITQEEKEIMEKQRGFKSYIKDKYARDPNSLPEAVLQAEAETYLNNPSLIDKYANIWFQDVASSSAVALANAYFDTVAPLFTTALEFIASDSNTKAIPEVLMTVANWIWEWLEKTVLAPLFSMANLSWYETEKLRTLLGNIVVARLIWKVLPKSEEAKVEWDNTSWIQRNLNPKQIIDDLVKKWTELPTKIVDYARKLSSAFWKWYKEDWLTRGIADTAKTMWGDVLNTVWDKLVNVWKEIGVVDNPWKIIEDNIKATSKEKKAFTDIQWETENPTQMWDYINDNWFWTRADEIAEKASERVQANVEHKWDVFRKIPWRIYNTYVKNLVNEIYKYAKEASKWFEKYDKDFRWISKISDKISQWIWLTAEELYRANKFFEKYWKFDYNKIDTQWERAAIVRNTKIDKWIRKTVDQLLDKYWAKDIIKDLNKDTQMSMEVLKTIAKKNIPDLEQKLWLDLDLYDVISMTHWNFIPSALRLITKSLKTSSVKDFEVSSQNKTSWLEIKKAPRVDMTDFNEKTKNEAIRMNENETLKDSKTVEKRTTRSLSNLEKAITKWATKSEILGMVEEMLLEMQEKFSRERGLPNKEAPVYWQWEDATIRPVRTEETTLYQNDYEGMWPNYTQDSSIIVPSEAKSALSRGARGWLTIKEIKEILTQDWVKQELRDLIKSIFED